MISDCFLLVIEFTVDGSLSVDRYNEVDNRAWRKIIQLRQQHDDTIIHDGSHSAYYKPNKIHLIFNNRQAAESFEKEILAYFNKFTYLTVGQTVENGHG